MEAMQTVIDTMKEEENRRLTIESKLRALESLDQKVSALNSTVFVLQAHQEETSHAKNFIERSLPMLVHLQLCEGLEVISGDYHDAL